MIEPNRDNIHGLLTAFIDGELDAADAERLRRYLSCHPELVRWADMQRQLTKASSRALGGPPPPAPESLRSRVRETADPRAPSVGGMTRTGRVTFVTRQAVAAVILIAVGGFIGAYLFRPPPPAEGQPSALVVPASIIAHANRIHADCSRLNDVDHAAAFPRGELSADVRKDLQSDNPYPDLSSIGYRYVGAGPCGHPLQGTVHLLYRTTRDSSRAAVSIFVQRFTGQFSLKENRLYSLAAPQSPFPTLAWRTNNVVYFLVADDEATEKQALDAIRAAPKQ